MNKDAPQPRIIPQSILQAILNAIHRNEQGQH